MSRMPREGRVRVKVKFQGELLQVSELSKRTGIQAQTLWNRLRAGVSYDKLIQATSLKSGKAMVNTIPAEVLSQHIPVLEEKKTGKIVNFPKSNLSSPLVPLGKVVSPYRLAVAGMISGEEYIALENELKRQKQEDDEVDQYG